METRNEIYNEFGTIDCEYNHPKFGWIPFTASPDDVDENGRNIHAAIIEKGGIAPYTPHVPTAEEIQAQLERKKQERIEFIKNKKLEQLLATQIQSINSASNDAEIDAVDI